MPFAHDTSTAMLAAVALVNTAGEPDTMATQGDLDTFFLEHDYTGSRTRDAVELETLRSLREPLRELLTSDRDHAVELVNAMLAAHRALPRLVRHDGWDYHVHATDPTTPWAERIAVETAMAMTDLIRSDELSRLSTCADDTCTGIVLDLSRNRSRRYCSTACGNRAAVAAYRSRQA